jgi:hypothetical protein
MGLLTSADGVDQRKFPDVSQLEAAGYHRCYTNNWKKIPGPNGTKVNVPCPFWLSPETIEMVKDKMGGYYTCPVCVRSYDLMHDMEWHGVPEQYAADPQFSAGGGTRIGILMTEQAQIGEDLVEHIGNLGDYGPITWWHQGGAATNSPLDGATQDWGIEVKTIGDDAMHHRFVPGRAKEKTDKNAMAEQMGKQGVLGVLVMLDYRRSVADIYVKEMPFAGHQMPGPGAAAQLTNGIAAFRSNAPGVLHLVKEVPFSNPLVDPHSPTPHVQTGDSPFSEQNQAGEGMPF